MELKPIRIGGVPIPFPLALAPMAGYTDAPFRRLCRQYGAGYTVTEMVSAKALTYQDQKSKTLLRLNEGEVPAAVQIFGSDLTAMQKGAQKALALSGAAILDINMGCPTPKIVNNGEGSALLLQPQKAAALVRGVAQAAAPFPVTVKTRLGYEKDSFTCVEFAKMCEQAGAAALTVHGRTKAQQYYGTADYEKIALVKKAVSIPVFANGDIKNGADAQKAMAVTGCDGIMIGRAALGNPFVFADVAAVLRGLAPPSYSLSQRLAVARAQVVHMIEDRGEKSALLEARKHLALYISGFAGAAALRARMASLSTLAQLDALLAEIMTTETRR